MSPDGKNFNPTKLNKAALDGSSGNKNTTPHFNPDNEKGKERNKISGLFSEFSNQKDIQQKKKKLEDIFYTIQMNISPVSLKENEIEFGKKVAELSKVFEQMDFNSLNILNDLDNLGTSLQKVFIDKF